MVRLPLSAKCFLIANLACAVAAQEFLWNTGSARSQAMGGVYVPSSRGAIDALITNPAGLADLSGRTLDLSLSGIFASGSFTNSANAGSPLHNSPGVVPSGAFGTPLGRSRFSLGVGVIPEITSAVSWSYKDSPGVGGADYGQQNEHSAILATRAVTGFGYALNKFLSMGASVGAVYNSNTLEGPYIFQSNPTLAGLKTLLNLHTSGFGWNTGVGVIVRPANRLQLNAAWRSKSTIDSTGEAFGSLKQQFAALGIAAAPGFHYSARVRNTLPQSVTAGASLRIDGRWVVALTGNFVNWKQAFARLPVSLSNGDNAAVNGLLGSTSLYDTVPVQWKNQFSIHGGVERLVSENVSIQAGFSHANNPVPASTLSPLTAAISANKITTGAAYRRDRWNFGLAYAVSPETSEHVQQSALKSGEYSHSTVRVGLQSLTLGASYQF